MTPSTYNGNLEWVLTIRDIQYGPTDSPGAPDLANVMAQIGGMLAAPLGDPQSPYDARSVYDSRPLNAFDGVLSATASGDIPWTVQFQSPPGYRVVPREWTVSYDSPGSGPAGDSTVTILLNGSALLFNGPIVIGPGTNEPIETFFLVEENSSFGMSGSNTNAVAASLVYVNVRCNFLPVMLDQLPYAVENRKPGT